MTTIDDDPDSTRVGDNQVKSSSIRKKNRERHIVDTFFGALFRIAISARFCRWGESKSVNLDNILDCFVERSREHTLDGILTLVGRYYGLGNRESFLSRGMDEVTILPGHLVVFHSFVGRYVFVRERVRGQREELLRIER